MLKELAEFFLENHIMMDSSGKNEYDECIHCGATSYPWNFMMHNHDCLYWDAIQICKDIKNET